MISPLTRLDSHQKELVYKSPLLVCILIAGADGTIDDKEVREAIQAAQRQDWVKSELKEFYLEVAEDFEDKLKMLIQSYPFEFAKRNEAIHSELIQLNTLWKKLGIEFSATYYETLKYLAKRVASSSGGIWKKIGPEEARLLDLPMLKDPSKN